MTRAGRPRFGCAAQVLIFSQFKIMLDLLAEYMQLCGHKYERIDGDVAARTRQIAIDRFSKGVPPCL